MNLNPISVYFLNIMISQLFLGMSLIGANWVLYLLLFLSVLSVSLIFERYLFYRDASKGLKEFRRLVRNSTEQGKLAEASKLAQTRVNERTHKTPDLETEMTLTLLSQDRFTPEILGELAHDAVCRARISWDRNLSLLATIGSNAPFIGLFGTVLGIIKAFHDLSQQAANNTQTVSLGISEALVATAVGILVAIPAVVAFNLFQRRVKSALAEAEALKSFLIGKLASKADKI